MNVPVHHGLRWIPEDDAQLRELAAERRTFAEIAEVMGRTESAVAVRAAWLGLDKRSRKRGVAANWRVVKP